MFPIWQCSFSVDDGGWYWYRALVLMMDVDRDLVASTVGCMFWLLMMSLGDGTTYMICCRWCHGSWDIVFGAGSVAASDCSLRSCPYWNCCGTCQSCRVSCSVPELMVSTDGEVWLNYKWSCTAHFTKYTPCSSVLWCIYFPNYPSSSSQMLILKVNFFVVFAVMALKRIEICVQRAC